MGTGSVTEPHHTPYIFDPDAQPSTNPVLCEVLSHLPATSAAFGYGSGVFHQPGLYSPGLTKPMLDFILAVPDPVEWHARNLARNRGHYSCIGSLGASTISRAAEGLGAGVYFNTLVPIGDQLVKYGVIRESELERDLTQWNSLYCAGRLQKPVAWVTAPPPRLRAAAARNLASALLVCRLLLPPTFGQPDLLHALCALSYRGDVRMGWAEDGAKLERLVAGQGPALGRLYAPALRRAIEEEGTLRALGPGVWTSERCEPLGARHLQALPEALLQRLQAAAAGHPSPQETAAQLARQLESAPHLARHSVQSALASIVRASSLRQTALGLLSGGVVKSARYGLAKVSKAWARRQAL
ncbi:TAM41 [Auxenochlorella protothecoides x Auxenochlorella symbiontica]